VDRARAVQPGFDGDGPAKAINRRASADGSTACPWLSSLPPPAFAPSPCATLAERLDDRFALLTRGARTALPRQQTLRAVVDWSYDLLFEDERRLFARLSVSSAAASSKPSRPSAPTTSSEHRRPRRHESAGGQVPRHGPDTRETRFTQLQTLWEYGTARLDDSDEVDTVRTRHAAYYRRFAENANERLRGAGAPEWRER